MQQFVNHVGDILALFANIVHLGLLIAIHSETALAQTTLVPSSYVAEENYLYCNPAPNGDKRHADFRPGLDHEPDIYPGLGLPLAPPASMLFGFLRLLPASTQASSPFAALIFEA